MLIGVAAVLLLTACSAVGNHARINALQEEFQSTEFPYDVVPNESHSIAGPDLELLDVNERNRIGGLARLDADMFEVADQTLEWLPTAGWESPVTSCNEDNGEVTATFIRGTKQLGSWQAQIRIGINPHREGGIIVGIHMDAPPAGETSLPPRDGEVAPCWSK